MIVSVSTPATTKDPATAVVGLLTLATEMLRESADPVTLAKVTVCAKEVSRTIVVVVLAMPDIVTAAVAPWLVRVVTPVALDRSSVEAVVVVKETLSMFFNAVGVTEPVTTATKESVPAPPSKLSPEFRVIRLPVDKPASNVSSPEVPVKLFVPVVSVWCVLCKYLILNAIIFVASINDEITT